jgi:hypothetical protein
MATAIITENTVRLHLMDRPELNTLLRGCRFSPEEINAAIVSCVAYYNESPPFYGSHSVESFPYFYTLLCGVSGYLLKSAAINEASNNLEYSANGVTVNDKNKAEIFLRIGGMFWDEFKQKVQDIKVSKNISAAFGSQESEYMRLAR